MEIIRPIGPPDDLDPIARVERLKDQQEERERQQEQQRRRKAEQRPPEEAPAGQDGPVEGDDGHLHIDVRA